MSQYFLIYLPGKAGLPALSALHPVNGLLILWTASSAACSAWQIVVANWPQGMSARRIALAVTIAVCVLATVAAGVTGPKPGRRAVMQQLRRRGVRIS